MNQHSAKILGLCIRLESYLAMPVGERFLNLHVCNVESIVSTVGRRTISVIRQTEKFATNNLSVTVKWFNVTESNTEVGKMRDCISVTKRKLESKNSIMYGENSVSIRISIRSSWDIVIIYLPWNIVPGGSSITRKVSSTGYSIQNIRNSIIWIIEKPNLEE